MLPQELIRRKRDGAPLKREDVKEFIAGLTSGTVSEGQVAAFAMAVFFRGMSREEDGRERDAGTERGRNCSGALGRRGRHAPRARAGPTAHAPRSTPALRPGCACRRCAGGRALWHIERRTARMALRLR